MSKISNLKNWNQFRYDLREFGFNSPKASILYNLYLDGEILDKDLDDSKYLKSFLIEKKIKETEKDSKYIKDDLLSKISSTGAGSDISSLIFNYLNDLDLSNLIIAYKINKKTLNYILYDLKDRIIDVGDNKELARKLSKLGFKVKLDLSHTKVKDVSALGSVHTLNLNYTKIKDVSTLGKVHTLDLRWTLVTNVSALSNVHTLDLSHTKVKNVSALGNVHTLNLSNTKVTDVSALDKGHTLDLSYTLVTDVSALGKVHTLDLTYTHVTDVRALVKVHTLIR